MSFFELLLSNWYSRNAGLRCQRAHARARAHTRIPDRPDRITVDLIAAHDEQIGAIGIEIVRDVTPHHESLIEMFDVLRMREVIARTEEERGTLSLAWNVEEMLFTRWRIVEDLTRNRLHLHREHVPMRQSQHGKRYANTRKLLPYRESSEFRDQNRFGLSLREHHSRHLRNAKRDVEGRDDPALVEDLRETKHRTKNNAATIQILSRICNANERSTRRGFLHFAVFALFQPIRDPVRFLNRDPTKLRREKKIREILVLGNRESRKRSGGITAQFDGSQIANLGFEHGENIRHSFFKKLLHISFGNNQRKLSGFALRSMISLLLSFRAYPINLQKILASVPAPTVFAVITVMV